MKCSFTIAGLKKSYKVNSTEKEITPQEKKLHRWNIAAQLNTDFLPLHACLIVKDNKGILICGESGSGKSTLAKLFIKDGYTIEANDFVVAWIDNKNPDKIFAGALDFENKNIKREATEITNCFFLTQNDSRDIFKYELSNAIEFYNNIMKPWPKKISLKYVASDIFYKLIEIHKCLGHRLEPIRWKKLILATLTPKRIEKIGIVGMGVMGQDIANLLITNRDIKQLNVFSTNYNKVKSIVLDINSALPTCKVVPCKSFNTCVENSDLIVFSFRKTEATLDKAILQNVEERYRRIATHMKIMWDYSRILRKLKFTGVCLVLTNPIDKLSEFLYQYTNMVEQGKYDWKGLFSNQIYGIGLGLDYARLHNLSNSELEVVGEHGEKQWLAVAKQSKLIQYKNTKIKHKLQNYSSDIRKFCDRTRFGPAHEVINIITSIMNNKKCTLRLSTLSKDGIFFGVPHKFLNLIPEEIYKFEQNLNKLLTSL